MSHEYSIYKLLRFIDLNIEARILFLLTWMMSPILFGQILWKRHASVVTDLTAVLGVQYASQAKSFL
jgi:hypothetical protein